MIRRIRRTRARTRNGCVVEHSDRTYERKGWNDEIEQGHDPFVKREGVYL